MTSGTDDFLYNNSDTVDLLEQITLWVINRHPSAINYLILHLPHRWPLLFGIPMCRYDQLKADFRIFMDSHNWIQAFKFPNGVSLPFW